MTALDAFEALTFCVGAAYFAIGVRYAVAARRARAKGTERRRAA